jgi:hypothetical protein
MLDPVRGHAGASIGPCEPGVYDGGGTCKLLNARGPLIPCAGGGIRGGLRGIL